LGLAVIFLNFLGEVLIIINNSASTQKSKKKYNIGFFVHPTTTKDSNMSRRCAVILGPPFAGAGQSFP
jgi:hypothetical protein